jgi:hypothetical protein
MDQYRIFQRALSEVNGQNFENIALELYRYQVANNPVYRSYITHLGRGVRSFSQIPFLPINFFKSHHVVSDRWTPETIFTSSGTSGTTTSRHAVRDVGFYLHHAEQIFTATYGPLRNFHVLALLPSYLERKGSSLVAMADHFIRQSASPHSGFYLNDHDALIRKIDGLKKPEKGMKSRRILLLGVTFALRELAEHYEIDLSGSVVMETGGMKGRGPEIVREELHYYLCRRWNISVVHAEYGMTELLSQAYSTGGGKFHPSRGMKIIVRDLHDPFNVERPGKTGGINVVDLANIDSCAFIETEDLGRINQDGSFEVLGRMDNSDVRGCNLLVGEAIG